MFSALHTLCGGNPSMTSQRARNDGVGVLFLVRVKKLMNKQSNNRIAGDVLVLTWMVSLKPYGVKHGWMPKGQLCKVLITKMLFSPCSLKVNVIKTQLQFVHILRSVCWLVVHWIRSFIGSWKSHWRVYLFHVQFYAHHKNFPFHRGLCYLECYFFFFKTERRRQNKRNPGKSIFLFLFIHCPFVNIEGWTDFSDRGNHCEHMCHQYADILVQTTEPPAANLFSENYPQSHHYTQPRLSFQTLVGLISESYVHNGLTANHFKTFKI